METQCNTAIVDVLRERIPGLEAVYLFGSQATGQSSADSDVDIAVLPARPLSSQQRFDLALELGTLVDRDADLVDLRAAHTVLRSQVITTGIALYRRDAAKVEAFEDFVFSDYARLNEERAAILEDVRARGSIHG